MSTIRHFTECLAPAQFYRLNILVMFMCVIQIGFGLLWFLKTLLGFEGDNEGQEMFSHTDDDTPLLVALARDLGSLELFVYTQAIFNGLLLVACLVAQRSIRNVNITSNLRFMWVLLWLIPIQIFSGIGLFDTYGVNSVWIKVFPDFLQLTHCPQGQ